MTTAEALTAVKNRLNITTTDFDTQLTDFFDTSIDRLFPKVMQEVTVQSTVPTIDAYGEATVDLSSLSTSLDDVRLVEATEGQSWYPVDSIYRHGTSLRVRDLQSSVTFLKIYGLKKYSVADAAVSIPEQYELPVLWFMMSEFYDYLSGNKAKYNIYTQSTGARAVDNMRDESEYYEDKAIRYIEDRANLYGTQ